MILGRPTTAHAAHRRHAALAGALLCAAAGLWLTARCEARVDVLTQHNNLDRTGANLRETVLTPAAVNVKHFGMLFKRVVDDQVYGQPLIATDVEIGGGAHDVAYVTTVNNSVYAFDANDAGAKAPFWHVNFGSPAGVHDWNFGCADINGNFGIVGAPVIDRATDALYVVALTKAGGSYAQRLHSLDIRTGADLPASPVTIEAPQFNPLMENQRAALALANGQVYVAYSSHCDKEPYHGFIFGYDAKTLRQTAAFNVTPTSEGGSIWQSGQAPAVDREGNIYVVTANGAYDGVENFGQSFLKLSPQLRLEDWFTPTDHAYLDSIDADIDSSGAMLAPGSDDVIDGGKQGLLYVVNRDHMGHLGNERAVQRFQATGSHLHSIVYWNSAENGPMLYLWGQRDHLRVYKFDGEKLNPTPFAMRPEQNHGHPGAMLSLSANGSRSGILWAAIHSTGDSWHESRPGILHAYAADDVMRELWNSYQDRPRDDCGNYSKMAPPSVANGKVYLASFGTKNIGSGQLCIYGLLPDGPPPAAPAEVHASARGGQVELSWSPVEAANTYSVTRSEDGGSTFTAVASGLTTPEFHDAAVSPGTTYIYKVTAANSNGESRDSPAATAAPPKRQSSGVPH